MATIMVHKSGVKDRIELCDSSVFRQLLFAAQIGNAQTEDAALKMCVDDAISVFKPLCREKDDG